ncbi:hypothetical protein F7734_43010 [Scytonema sp. UIC 10036]|uniref:hypothetical protein n=1 Tax=Scytonema sp. UIC 10036 TaxID=2304196 RepID=UPI0012DAF714|nr:hypothetical protein [Scytonema sp. UIC 10036]MUG98706.1 hypothetical protein [Scytonema sp. UIC 10036]
MQFPIFSLTGDSIANVGNISFVKEVQSPFTFADITAKFNNTLRIMSMFPSEFSESIKKEFGSYGVHLCEHLDLICKHRAFNTSGLKGYKTALKIIALKLGKDLTHYDNHVIVNFRSFWTSHYTPQIESKLKIDSEEYELKKGELKKWIINSCGGDYHFNKIPIFLQNLIIDEMEEALEFISNNIEEQLETENKAS